MIKKKTFLLLPLFAILSGALFLGIVTKNPSPESEGVVISESQPVTAIDLDKLEKISQKIVKEIDLEKPLPKNGEVNSEKRMLIGFQRMQMSIGKFNSSAFIKGELNKLLENPEVIDIAQNTLLSLDNAKENFGEDQALARVYSVKLLGELAERGEPYVLYDTTRRLAELLDQQASTDQEFSKRQDLDLEELVYMSVNTFRDDQVVNHPETVMGELGYNDEQHEKVRKIYANTFGSVFLRDSTIDESIARVQELFNKKGSSNG